jgi:hypothetical protein
VLPLIYDKGLARRQSIGVQQSPMALSACTQIATANGTAQQTITITPPAGQFFYLCALDLQYCASGSAAKATAGDHHHDGILRQPQVAHQREQHGPGLPCDDTG